jgi:hypothetical protein
VLALRQSDLVGKATVSKGYVVDPAAISDYSVFMVPAGQFDALDQEIEWFPAANEASFYADFENAAALEARGTTGLDLSGLGDGAQGSVTEGSSFSGGQVFFSSGRLAEFIFMGSQSAVSSADVTSVAQAAARTGSRPPGSVADYAPTTWTSQRRSRSRSSSMKRTRCQVPSWSSPSRTGTDSPAVPSSIAMQCEWPLPWSMSSGQMFSVRRSQSSCA